MGCLPYKTGAAYEYHPIWLKGSDAFSGTVI